MPIKHQSNCYRNISGRLYRNMADLYRSEEENKEVIKEVKEQYKYVRLIKHPSGYYQLFATN